MADCDHIRVERVPKDGGPTTLVCFKCGAKFVSVALASELQAELETAKQERNSAAQEARMGTWLWSDTDDNDLGSLAASALVTMTARQLRALLTKERQLFIGMCRDEAADAPRGSDARTTASNIIVEVQSREARQTPNGGAWCAANCGHWDAIECDCGMKSGWHRTVAVQHCGLWKTRTRR